MIICMRTSNDTVAQMRRLKRTLGLVLLASAMAAPGASRADTVASLLGNFTINQYCGLELRREFVEVHYVVVFGQLPALRELHLADTDGDGVTSQAERDAYVGRLAPGFAQSLELKVDGSIVPLHATHWASSLPTEQGGFSLRVDVDLAAALPPAPGDALRRLEFINRNYAGRMGWHEIVIKPAPGLMVFDTNSFSTSLTGGLTEALQSLPAAGPLDERTARLSFGKGAPPGAALLRARNGTATASPTRTTPTKTVGVTSENKWISVRTRRLVDAISGPHVPRRVGLLALLGAFLLGAVHALSPGHGKTIVGAYLIGSRGTPRHAAFSGPDRQRHPHDRRIYPGFRDFVRLAVHRARTVVPHIEPDIRHARTGNGHRIISTTRTCRTPGAAQGSWRSSTYLALREIRSACTHRRTGPHFRACRANDRCHDALTRRGSDAFAPAARRGGRKDHLAQPTDPRSFGRPRSLPLCHGVAPRRDCRQ